MITKIIDEKLLNYPIIFSKLAKIFMRLSIMHIKYPSIMSTCKSSFKLYLSAFIKILPFVVIQAAISTLLFPSLEHVMSEPIGVNSMRSILHAIILTMISFIMNGFICSLFISKYYQRKIEFIDFLQKLPSYLLAGIIFFGSSILIYPFFQIGGILGAFCLIVVLIFFACYICLSLSLFPIVIFNENKTAIESLTKSLALTKGYILETNLLLLTISVLCFITILALKSIFTANVANFIAILIDSPCYLAALVIHYDNLIKIKSMKNMNV